MNPEIAQLRGRRSCSLRPGWRLTVMVFGLVMQISACGGSDGAVGVTSGGGSGSGGGTPPTGTATVGAHALVFQRIGTSDQPVIETSPMSTFASGSTLIVGVGRGRFNAFEPPTDNMNNGAYQRIGVEHTYTLWPNSGTALYAVVGANGGDGHVISNNTPASDEITLAAVEVYGGQIEQAVWTEVLAGQALTSASVTTTGPATLVAYWWGDDGKSREMTVVPNNDFTVIDSHLASISVVQCAVAVKHVDAAGTYDVTWTATPTQGAQLWLVAVAD